MNIGERIYQLRASKNMSQTDLAEALDVSRQSISKWETGVSTPELEKLVNLSSLFGITLDELVNGADVTERAQPIVPQPEQEVVEQSVSKKKTSGIILFCMAFLTVIICIAMGGFTAGILSSLPLIVGGIVCSKAKKRTRFFFVWSVYMFVRIFWMLIQTTDLYMALSVNFSEYHLIIWNVYEYINFLLSIVYVVVEIFTFISFKDTSIKINVKNKVIYALLWLLLIVFSIPYIPTNIPLTIYNFYKSLIAPICTAIPIMTLGFVRYKNTK